MKTQNKIAVIFFLITVAIITILSGSVYYFALRYSLNDFYGQLESRAYIAARENLDIAELELSNFEELREIHVERFPNEQDFFFEIFHGKDFSIEAQEMGLPTSFFEKILSDNRAEYQNGNTFYYGIRYTSKIGEYAVIVSADNYYNSHHLSDLWNIFLLVTVVTSILVLGLSVVFSKYVFVPVKAITNRVRDISTGNLHLRLEQTGSNDEISGLTNTFNDMLDRLETVFETQSNFISNASHELRTPLTTIIGEGDVALSKDREGASYKESIKVMLKEAEKLERITKSLLYLAQTGFDGKKQNFEIIRSDQLLWDVKETIEKLNPEAKISVDLRLMPENPAKLNIKGNDQLLHLALANLLNNACKYSYNMPVRVSLGASDDKVFIIVKDEGIGIPENELKHIYDPFFRASNTKGFEGYGIGLPLTRNIIRMHGGEIRVSSYVNRGTTIQLTFPAGVPIKS